ncbi:MAG: RES domain-containing protein [Candidatus Omnitrophota bacterium]
MTKKIISEIDNELIAEESILGNSKFVSPDEWGGFCTYLLKQNRYVLSKKWKRFIETVLFTAKKREHLLKSGSVLCRARIGSDEHEYEDDQGEYRIDINPLPPPEIDAPLSGKAIEGRINPKGISYLYLANSIETAISEVRPWLKQEVTVGRFSLGKDVLLVDASQDKHSRYVLSERKIEEPSEKWEPFVWRDINQSFSIPVIFGEEHIHYVPTQYLSECFKNAVS